MYDRYLGRLEEKHSPPKISNVVVPACLSLKKDVDVATLRKSVFRIAQNQRNLSHAVTKEGEKLKFVCADPNYEYFEVLPVGTDWKELCKHFGNKFLHSHVSSNPPFKVFFIPSTNTNQVCLVAVYMHFAGDGTNGMTIINDILTVYEGLVHDGQFNYPEFKNPPTVEDMAMSVFCEGDDKMNGKMKYEQVKQKFVEYSLNIYSKMNHFPSHKKGSDAAINVSHLYYLSSPTIYSKFIEKCKENNVTVGTVLTAVKYFAYASYMFQDQKQINGELFLGCNVPINLRQRVSLDIDSNCVNLSVTQCLLGLGLERQTLFWKFVEDIKQKYIEYFENKFHLFSFAATKEISESTIVKNVAEKHGLHFHFCFSNMRRYPRSCEYKDFDLQSIHCVGGTYIDNWDHMELMVYSTNRFNFSLLYRDYDLKVAEYVFSLIEYLTENICSLSDNFMLKNLIEKRPISENGNILVEKM